MEMVNSTFQEINTESKFQSLLDEITKKRVQPEDKFEIAAMLESMGWNDTRASDVFGVEDVFSLAEDLWNALQKRVLFTPHSVMEKAGFLTVSLALIRSFLRGVIFALPMTISVFSMLSLKYSLWSYENLRHDLATSIAIGTILSFMAVGGFTQAIARRGFFYITQGYYNMGRRITFYFVKLGYIVCFVTAVISMIFVSFFDIFPFYMILTVNAYFFFLSAIWLSVTVMYILQKEITFTGLLAGGILIVFILVQLFGIDNIIFYQIAALIIVSVSGILLVLYFFVKAEKKMEKGIAPSMPRMSITLYSIMPYFVYGFLYFTFLFTDRIIAWSTNDKTYMPYLIWFRGPYELGLDFALLMLTLPMGLIEVVVTRLMNSVESSQRNYMAAEAGKLNISYLKSYYRYITIVAIFSIFNAGAVYFAVKGIDYAIIQGKIPSITAQFLANPTTNFVLIVSLVSYVIITIALMNSVILFSLSQPEIVNRSILPALVINVIIGFLLSRWATWWVSSQTGYSFAVFGLLAGSIVFTYLTTVRIINVFKNLDYYFYAGT